MPTAVTSFNARCPLSPRAQTSVSSRTGATVGGPGVFPPQPTGVYSFTQVPRVWTPSTGPTPCRDVHFTSACTAPLDAE